MIQATRVLSTPPTNTSAMHYHSYGLLEGSIIDVFHMSNIVASKSSDADGTASLQQLEELRVLHLSPLRHGRGHRGPPA